MNVDLIVEDREDKPILIVEVKSVESGADGLFQLIAYLQSADPPIPFGMLVDPERIRLVSQDVSNPSSPVIELSSVDVLQNYDPEFEGMNTPYGTKKIFQYYLTGLVQSWLNDLAGHWKYGEPPGSAELARSGLLERMEGGLAIEGASTRDDAIR
jgi:hypothetical protein